MAILGVWGEISRTPGGFSIGNSVASFLYVSRQEQDTHRELSGPGHDTHTGML